MAKLVYVFTTTFCSPPDCLTRAVLVVCVLRAVLGGGSFHTPLTQLLSNV